MIRHFITAALAALALNAFAAVDANKANQADLEGIKGIGPGLSTKIIAARQAGTFKDWNDMVERVSGVGPGNAMRLSQAGLTVGGAEFVKSAAGDKPRKNAEPRQGKASKAGKAGKVDKMT